MKKTLITIIVFSFLISHFSLLALAQESTDSADVSEEEIKENISDRLKKVAGSKDENTTQIKQGWAGSIEDITQNNSLSVKTNGETKMAQVDPDAKIINDDKKTIKFENLEIGQYILAMGYLQDNQVLDTKRIVSINQPKPLKYQNYLATIKEINDGKITIQIENSTFTLEYDDDTQFSQAVDSEQAEIELSDLQENDQVILIATPDPKDDTTLLATNIHLLKGRTILADPDSATPSAETE